MSSTFLSDDEVAEICAPLKLHSAQRRHLQSLGMLVASKPNGRALVARSEVERVLGAARFAQPATAGAGSKQPDRAALLQVINGGKRGPQAQRR